MDKVVVGKSVEKEIEKGVPLIFGTVVKKIIGEPKKGELVEIIDEQGKFLAKGFYNPKAAAIVQIVSKNQKEEIDEKFFEKKIRNALEFRENVLGFENFYRLFFGEADGIPGLVVDRFNQIAVIQTSCPGVELWKNQIASILLGIEGIKTVFERNDSRSRIKIGLPINVGLLKGEKRLQAIVEENGVKFEIDVMRGHKTGFYLDQRENRIKFEEYIKEGMHVLDVFSYTGGFGLHAAKKKAGVTMIDLKPALKEARRNAELNGFNGINFIEGNAFEETKKLFGRKEKFDIVCLDPPSFVQKSSDLQKGKKAYHQINYNCIKLVKPGGLLVTSSCSHFLEPSDFIDVIVSAAANAGRKAILVEQRAQARDHCTSLASKTGNYLKCLFLRIE